MGRRSSRKAAIGFADCEVSSNADFLQTARGGQKIKRRRVPIENAPTKNPRTIVRGFLLFHCYLFTLHLFFKYSDFWKVISNSE